MTRRALVFLVFVACSGDPGTGKVAGFEMGNADRPPTGADAVNRWLQDKHYERWACEASPHEERGSSPHDRNRICSNMLISKHESGPYPVGASAVKELYEDDKVNGYALYLKVREGTGSDTWYWFERIGSSIIADGVGSSGKPKDTCSDCHSSANDFVFTQVR